MKLFGYKIGFKELVILIPVIYQAFQMIKEKLEEFSSTEQFEDFDNSESENELKTTYKRANG